MLPQWLVLDGVDCISHKTFGRYYNVSPGPISRPTYYASTKVYIRRHFTRDAPFLRLSRGKNVHSWVQVRKRVNGWLEA